MRHFLNSSPIRVRAVSKLCIIVLMKKCLNFNGSKQPSIIGALYFFTNLTCKITNSCKQTDQIGLFNSQ